MISLVSCLATDEFEKQLVMSLMATYSPVDLFLAFTTCPNVPLPMTEHNLY